MLPRATQERNAARGRARTRRRPHARDSANHRARVARRYRYRQARRTHDLDRLRRHSGRRRHADRRGHAAPTSRWRSRCAGSSIRPTKRAGRSTRWSPRSASASSPECRCSISPTTRIVRRSRRHERLYDRCRALRGDPRHGRSGTVRPARTRCVAGSRRWRNTPYLRPAELRRSTRRCPCMPVDAGLLALVQRVGAFHITQRGMKRAQAADRSGDRARRRGGNAPAVVFRRGSPLLQRL